ncbi:MAG: phosphotransferase, partial [Anaerolineae bacterium]|nr:phosphotransferase [Anaerolineae bacterium]
LSLARRGVFEQIFEKFPAMRVNQLAITPLTLIHDDPHAGNFLYPRDPQKDTLRIIDWKSWCINPGVSDLAHLMAVFWFPERRKSLEKELLRRYCERLSERGIDYNFDNCWHDYRLCVISYLTYPLRQWSMGLPDFIWWHNLERVLLAYDDLHCAELLN